MNRDIVLENKKFRLVIGEDAIAKSLVVKSTGAECLRQDEDIALFSVTQERPFNNEVKLAHPNKRTTYQANRVRREGSKLIVNFEIVPVEAVIEVKESDSYIAFTLTGFNVEHEHYGGLKMQKPPVAELRLIQLPIANREHFGEWLNVSWDEKAAVNVLAVNPYAVVDSERRKGYRIMTADVRRDLKLKNCTVALVAAAADELMDSIDQLEQENNLPLGVQSRRGPRINASAYHSGSITPLNVDEHIKYAKMGGFRMMLIYYTSIFKEHHGYGLCGDYDYRDEYPNGAEDLKKMLAHIKANGITPGIHFLQTHIGMWSRYVTPVADHRLNLTKHFTLAKPLTKGDTTVYVENNPEGTVLADGCRILKFGGELISYENYTTEYPYCFYGCQRGHQDTYVTEHPMGEIGGILDVSEFGGSSVYLDQNSSLQDEVGKKLADAYNCGFEFIYFDGSEGTNAPFDVHVPNAQYRVYKKLEKKPLYTEGAAKAHFSWHFLSGGNAFDVFPPPIFKPMIDRFPAEEAPRMREDFTRLNFGWWGYWTPGEKVSENTVVTQLKEADKDFCLDIGTQPDMLEYGTSRAAAWDCPVTVITNLDKYQAHPRTADNLEVMKRWEDVRESKWLTDEQKLELRKLGNEHILLINEDKEFELVPYQQITPNHAGVRAFAFERKGATWVVYWHTFGEATLKLPVAAADVEVRKELYEDAIAIEGCECCVKLPISDRRYIKTALSVEAIKEAFDKAELI